MFEMSHGKIKLRTPVLEKKIHARKVLTTLTLSQSCIMPYQQDVSHPQADHQFIAIGRLSRPYYLVQLTGLQHMRARIRSWYQWSTMSKRTYIGFQMKYPLMKDVDFRWNMLGEIPGFDLSIDMNGHCTVLAKS